MPDDVPEIDEAARRWPDFQGGRAIVLPDGQTWTFYVPAMALRPTANDDGEPGLVADWTWGVGVPHEVDDALSDRFRRLIAKWDRATNDADRAAAVAEAAWFLLARNYNIAAEEFEAILGQASEWNAERQRALGAALLGVVGLACLRSTGLLEVA